MAIQTKFEIEGLVRNVLDFTYKLTQSTDSTGRPLTEYTGGIFKIIVEGDRETDLYEWAIASDMMKKCKLTHSSRFGTGRSTTIELLDVYCVAYREHISSLDEAPYSIEIAISPATMIQNGTVIFSKFWRKTDPYRGEVPLTVREENKEPELIECFFTTLEGEKIDQKELVEGTEIYYVIKTKNAVGKQIDLDLADAENDYIYQGEPLPEDLIEDLQITSDTQKVKLGVIRQQ